MRTSLGDRMKANYELRQRRYLTRRTPIIVRVDGRAFHTFTREFDKPFDYRLMEAMLNAALQVFGDAQGCKMAYVQSDEVSFVLTDYDKLDTQGWFNYNASKIESISASCMTMGFNRSMRLCNRPGTAMFDARTFNIPEDEVANYFLWRAQDWHRNSVMMYAQSFFSHRELHGKTGVDIHEMLHSIGKNWTRDLYDDVKNGTFIIRENGATYTCDTILPKYAAISKWWDRVRPKEID